MQTSSAIYDAAHKKKETQKNTEKETIASLRHEENK